jgi:hypothetical protein
MVFLKSTELSHVSIRRKFVTSGDKRGVHERASEQTLGLLKQISVDFESLLRKLERYRAHRVCFSVLRFEEGVGANTPGHPHTANDFQEEGERDYEEVSSPFLEKNNYGCSMRKKERTARTGRLYLPL